MPRRGMWLPHPLPWQHQAPSPLAQAGPALRVHTVRPHVQNQIPADRPPARPQQHQAVPV